MSHGADRPLRDEEIAELSRWLKENEAEALRAIPLSRAAIVRAARGLPVHPTTRRAVRRALDKSPVPRPQTVASGATWTQPGFVPRLTPSQERDLSQWMDRFVTGIPPQSRAEIRRQVTETLIEEYCARGGGRVPTNAWTVIDLSVAAAGHNSSGNTPDHQRRAWQFSKTAVRAPELTLPPEIERLPDRISVEAYRDLQREILGRIDWDSRWVEQSGHRDHPRFHVLPLHRSAENAAAWRAAIDVLDSYKRDILTALHRGDATAAIAQIRAIIEACGYRIAQSEIWGGTELVRADAPPAMPEFPDWLLRDQIKKEARTLAHFIKRPLTASEVENHARPEATATLRRRTWALLEFGITIDQKKTMERQLRRWREADRRQPRVRISASLRDKIAAELEASPWTSANSIAKKMVGYRRQDVLAIVRSLKAEQKHRVMVVPEVVPPYSVESAGPPSRVRIAQVQQHSAVDQRVDPVPEAVPPYFSEAASPSPMRVAADDFAAILARPVSEREGKLMLYGSEELEELSPSVEIETLKQKARRTL